MAHVPGDLARDGLAGLVELMPLGLVQDRTADRLFDAGIIGGGKAQRRAQGMREGKVQT